MIDIYLLTVLILLLTEYGFQSRQAAVSALLGDWPVRRTLLRLALWLGVWLLAGVPRSPVAIGFLALAALLTELAVWLLRARLRRDAAAGAAHGRIATHLLPLAFALPPALVGWALVLGGLPGPGAIVRALPQAVLRGAVGFVSLWCWGTLLTVSVIDRVRPESLPHDEAGAVGAGEVIGVLERVLAFALILLDAPTAVAIGIAAKSAVRFPEFKDKAFAEYFLVGTLTSIGIGLAAAVLTFA